MRSIHLFMFIVMIPALAALGHDIYLFIQNSNIEEAYKAIESGERSWTSHFAALGYIWTTYDAESFKIFAQSMDQDTWKIVNSILACKAVLVGLIFGLFWWIVAWLLNTLNLFGFGGTSTKSHAQSDGKIKYNRK